MAAALPEHFWSKVDRDVTGCWLWTGAKNSRGYGCWGVRGRSHLTHRLAYEALVGPIPTGLTIDHLCRVRACCNPAHLEPVDARENLVRGDTLTAHQVQQTHCLRGHPLSGENLYLRPDRFGRMCRECRNMHRRAA